MKTIFHSLRRPVDAIRKLHPEWSEEMIREYGRQRAALRTARKTGRPIEEIEKELNMNKGALERHGERCKPCEKRRMEDEIARLQAELEKQAAGE
jgi:hypothetical protein